MWHVILFIYQVMRGRSSTVPAFGRRVAPAALLVLDMIIYGQIVGGVFVFTHSHRPAKQL